MFTDFLIILSVSKQTTKTGSPYLTVSCRDLSTIYSVNVWNVSESQVSLYKLGNLIRFDNIKSDNGFYSCASSMVTIKQPSDDNPLLQFIPRPVSKAEWLRLGDSLASLCSSKESSFIKSQFSKLYQPYSISFAARSHHHAFKGGLLQHTYELLHIYEGLHSVLPYHLDHFSVIVAALFHDFGKLSEYNSQAELQPAFFLQGHPFIGAQAVGSLLLSEGFPQNQVEFIQSCVLSHHGRREWGSPVVPCSPEAFVVSILDSLSGTGVQYDVPSGTKALDTVIYRLDKSKSSF